MMKKFSTKTGSFSCWTNPADFGAHALSLVFIHGSGSDSGVWSNQYGKLYKQFNIAAINLPGHGKSDGAGAQSASGYVEHLEEMLCSLKLDKPVLIGHSLGAAVSLLYAARHPDAVLGVVSVGGGLAIPVNPAILDSLSENPSGIKDLIAKLSIATANRPKLLAAIRKSLDDVRLEVLKGDLTACNHLDLHDQAPNIRVPVLAVCGLDDKMTPVQSSRDVVTAVPDADLLLIENAGHMVMMEQPDCVNKAICDFAAKLIKETSS